MEEIRPRTSPIRFDVFELDLEAGELRRKGVKVKLQEQPFQVLALLLDRPGEVVTREELQGKLWPSDTFVDFDRGLNRAINKLREALGDDAENPRLIETLPRRGYRFVASVLTTAEPRVEPPRRALELVTPDPSPKPEQPGNPRLRLIASWTAAAVLVAFAFASLWRLWLAPQAAGDRPFLQLDLDLGPNEFSQLAIAPDGTQVVFVSKGALAIRRFDQTKETPLHGTDGAELPFFSPDGRWVGFLANGKLQKIAVAGGVPIQLCDLPRWGGASWGADDRIVVSDGGVSGLLRIPAAGGAPEHLTNSRSDSAGVMHHLWPQVLPGGNGILFASTDGSVQGSLRILDLKNGQVKTVVENATHGRIGARGFLIYYQRENLFAAHFDLHRLEVRGPAMPLLSGVAKAGWGRGDFDASETGTVVYRADTTHRNFIASWLYPSGKTEPALTLPGNYHTPRLSPDGKRLALGLTRDGAQNLWVYDMVRQTFTRLTFGPGPDFLPAWTPDGAFIGFRSGNTLAWIRSDGSGKVEHLEGVSRDAGPWSFSADGKWMAYFDLQPGSDIWAVPVERTAGSMRMGQPVRLTEGAGSKGVPAISPDGRWVAYTSDESGRFEIYVIPFSPAGKGAAKWQVSRDGGTNPMWASGNSELFYEDPGHQVYAARYAVRGESLVPATPRQWAEAQLPDTDLFAGFDLAPAGDRVLAFFPATQDPRDKTLAHLILNLDGELRRRAAHPAK